MIEVDIYDAAAGGPGVTDFGILSERSPDAKQLMSNGVFCMIADTELTASGVTKAAELPPYTAPVLVELDVAETQAFNGGAGDANTGS